MFLTFLQAFAIFFCENDLGNLQCLKPKTKAERISEKAYHKEDSSHAYSDNKEEPYMADISIKVKNIPHLWSADGGCIKCLFKTAVGGFCFINIYFAVLTAIWMASAITSAASVPAIFTSATILGPQEAA